MLNHAVLTGDIIKSRDISDRDTLLHKLTDVLDLVTAAGGCRYELYRGDSFQLHLEGPASSVEAAFLIRAALIAASPSRQERWDARISIGIGQIDYHNPKVTTSDGEAFRLSGEGMDKLAAKNRNLRIETPWDTRSDGIELLTRLADDIVSNWSHFSAETMYYAMRDHVSQNKLAARLKKSQPTINQRLATAKSHLVFEYLEHISNYLKQKLEP